MIEDVKYYMIPYYIYDKVLTLNPHIMDKLCEKDGILNLKQLLSENDFIDIICGYTILPLIYNYRTINSNINNTKTYFDMVEPQYHLVSKSGLDLSLPLIMSNIMKMAEVLDMDVPELPYSIRQLNNNTYIIVMKKGFGNIITTNVNERNRFLTDLIDTLLKNHEFPNVIDSDIFRGYLVNYS